jgi:hypothetical protein
VCLVFICGKEGVSYRSDNFNEQHSMRSPIDHSIARRIIQRCEQTGSVLDSPRSGRHRSATDDVTARAIFGISLSYASCCVSISSIIKP